MNRSRLIQCVCAAMLLSGFLRAESVGRLMRDCEGLQLHEKLPARVELNGSSNVHNWRAYSEGLTLVGDKAAGLETLAGIVSNKAGGAGNLKSNGIVFALPVSTLSASNPRMLRDLKEAVGHPDHSQILYRLRSAAPVAEGSENWNVQGIITVAGKDHEITHEIHVKNGGPHQWVGRGVLDLKMSWFGIAPPRALMGLVRADDRFQVKFEVRVQAVCDEEPFRVAQSGKR